MNGIVGPTATGPAAPQQPSGQTNGAAASDAQKAELFGEALTGSAMANGIATSSLLKSLIDTNVIEG